MKKILVSALFGSAALLYVTSVYAAPTEPFKFEILPQEKCKLEKIDPNPDPVLKCLKGTLSFQPTRTGKSCTDGGKNGEVVAANGQEYCYMGKFPNPGQKGGIPKVKLPGGGPGSTLPEPTDARSIPPKGTGCVLRPTDPNCNNLK
jgi:hypothetical protein